MELKPIRTKRDYQCALSEVSPSFDHEPTPGSEAGNRFEILIMLIEAYEAKQFAITPPTPIEAIKFRMEQSGLTVKDLEPMIGRSSRVYEVLNGKRSLTLPMIRRLHSMLGIPAESLIA
jgi:HTH-type transcriptional regulator / antitoxin HigA